jgi:hypothetical protein
MSDVLHLSSAQAQPVAEGGIAGPSTVAGYPDSVLVPEPLTDGTFYVGVEVTADPAYANRSFAGIPVVDFQSLIDAGLVPTPVTS